MSYTELTAIHKVWELTQRPMKAVTRFGNFPDYGQLLVEHQASLPVTLAKVHAKLYPVMHELEWYLLSRCCTFHDCGEPLTGGDEHIDNKTDDKDEREYWAFRQMLINTGDFYRHTMMAFLLPYVRRPLPSHVLFGDDAGLYDTLCRTRYREAAVFELVERIDYIKSGLSGRALSIRNENELLYDHVVKRQTPFLDALVREYPVFSHVWSPDVRHMLWSLIIEP